VSRFEPSAERSGREPDVVDAAEAQRHLSEHRSHIVSELGLGVIRADGEARGVASVSPEMWAPDTRCVRTSILALWVDIVAGHLAVDAFSPRVPVTLELDVHLYGPPVGCRGVEVVGRPLKSGRSVVVLGVELRDDRGRPLGIGHGSFVAAPNPALRMPRLPDGDQLLAPRAPSLRVPFAERARCERWEPGVALLPRSDDGLNASGTVNGGLLALVAEEAALSLRPGATLSSMAIRYLQPVRRGPAVARAEMNEGLGRIEVRDAGADGRLSVVVITRAFEPGDGSI
jgi:acyl-coenzyme A thioesterase PaaI-like protein